MDVDYLEICSERLKHIDITSDPDNVILYHVIDDRVYELLFMYTDNKWIFRERSQGYKFDEHASLVDIRPGSMMAVKEALPSTVVVQNVTDELGMVSLRKGEKISKVARSSLYPIKLTHSILQNAGFKVYDDHAEYGEITVPLLHHDRPYLQVVIKRPNTGTFRSVVFVRYFHELQAYFNDIFEIELPTNFGYNP